MCTGYTSAHNGYYTLMNHYETRQIFQNQYQYITVADEQSFIDYQLGHIGAYDYYGLIINTKTLSYGTEPALNNYTYSCLLYDDLNGVRRAYYVPSHRITVFNLVESFTKEEIEKTPILAFARDIDPSGAETDVHQTQLVPNPLSQYEGTSLQWNYNYTNPNLSAQTLYDRSWVYVPDDSYSIYQTTDQQIKLAGITVGIIMLFMVLD